MTDEIERVAAAMWKADAERINALKSVVAGRTPEAFAGENVYLRDKWRSLARAAISAMQITPQEAAKVLADYLESTYKGMRYIEGCALPDDKGLEWLAYLYALSHIRAIAAEDSHCSGGQPVNNAQSSITEIVWSETGGNDVGGEVTKGREGMGVTNFNVVTIDTTGMVWTSVKEKLTPVPTTYTKEPEK